MNKYIGFTIIIVLFAFLFSGMYFLWMLLPSEPTPFETFKLNESYAAQLGENSSQFYPNMRFKDKSISYSVESNCSDSRLRDIEGGLKEISDNTILSFYKKETGEIMFYCSNKAPEPVQKDHFIAGEGGPTEIVNSTKYSVILKAQVSLFRPEKCDVPKVSVHEVLHALGFEHTKNKESIMYPVSDCSQQIDISIIREINRLYSTDSLPDLAIERVNASIIGRYVDFEIWILNAGLKDFANGNLIVYGDDQQIKSFDIGAIDIGSRKKIMISNLAVPRSISKLKFYLQSDDGDLDTSNNAATLSII